MDERVAGAAAFRTHSVMEGEGPCVLLIHGVGLDHRMWSPQAAALSRDFNVLRYDLLGHGLTPAFPGEISLDSLVGQLSALLEEHGVTRAHVVGFSLGSLIAQAFALARPECLMRLVLLSGVYDRSHSAREAVLERLKLAELSGPDSLVEGALDRWFTDGYRKSHQRDIAMIEQRLRHNSPQGFLPAYRLFARADEWLAGRLGKISAPTLVVTGEQDPGSTPDMAKRMSEAMPDADCRIIAGVRHMLPMEAAEELNVMLKTFLSNSESKS